MNTKIAIDKNILDILDGDALLDTYCGVDYKMPYLSGPAICRIGDHFNANIKYDYVDGNLPRWKYMEKLIKYCIEIDKLSQLLVYLFNKTQFAIQDIKKL